MRNISTLLLLFTMWTAGAQQQPVALPHHMEQRETYRNVHTSTPGHAKEIAYYEENFDSGQSGWIATAVVGELNWGWTDVGPAPTSSSYPVPPLNSSTPAGWMMIDDDHDGQPGQNTESWLVSPTIDLSFTSQHVKLEFEQFFQEFESDRTFVGISTNGGSSWSEVEVNEGVGRDGRPNPEMIDVDISEWLSNERSSVLIRFRYVSVFDYGWQIDNIAIRDLPEHDMALLKAALTAFDFDNTGFAQMDYSIYPMSQLTTLQPSVVARNKGYAQETGVHATFEVMGPSGTLQNATAPITFAPATEATLPLDPYVQTSALGTYAVTFGIEQDTTDMVPDNNVTSTSFAVSENIFAHDDGAVQAYQVQGPDHVDDAFEVGNHFLMTTDGSLTGIQVAVHPNTPMGSSIYGAVYLPATTATSHPTLIDLTANHTITAAEISGLGEAEFITLPFTTPVPLEGGQAYLLMAGSSIGHQNVHFATSGISSAQVSVIHYPTAGSGFEFYITRTPMVRMQLAGQVGITESNNSIDGVSVTPVPVAERATIDYDVARSGQGTLRITDMAGKLMEHEDLGTLPQGPNRAILNVQHLAPGIYHVAVTVSDRILGRRFVVAR